MSLRVLLSRCLVLAAWGFSRLFYRHRLSWVRQPEAGTGPLQLPGLWTQLRVFAFLNHTSLLEPLFFGAFPLSFLMHAAGRTTIPGADITLRRPLIGRFYRFLSPRTVAITRKRDASWEAFLNQISPAAMVALAPEGRMMRADGLDKHGRPMSVRGGIADILVRIGQGSLMIAYSGGLHHVNRPGERRLRLFKTLHLRLEVLDIADYLAGFGEVPITELRRLIAQDLEARLARERPGLTAPDNPGTDRKTPADA